MKITKEIDSCMLELSRKGLKPRYIVIGQNQYMRWAQESDLSNFEELDNIYLGCDVVICGSDILEIVPEPKELYNFFSKNV